MSKIESEALYNELSNYIIFFNFGTVLDCPNRDLDMIVHRYTEFIMSRVRHRPHVLHGKWYALVLYNHSSNSERPLNGKSKHYTIKCDSEEECEKGATKLHYIDVYTTLLTFFI